MNFPAARATCQQCHADQRCRALRTREHHLRAVSPGDRFRRRPKVSASGKSIRPIPMSTRDRAPPVSGGLAAVLPDCGSWLQFCSVLPQVSPRWLVGFRFRIFWAN